MKAKLLITAALIFALAFTSSAQCTTDTSKTLLADETWLTYSKTGAKITSYSESAFTDISLKFGDQFKRILSFINQAVMGLIRSTASI